MNMTQKFLATLAVAASAMMASAGTLYWQVAGENEGDTFTSATLYTSTDRNATGASATALGTVSEENGTLFTDGLGTYSDQMQTDISAYSGNSPEYFFFVEMANYNGEGNTKRGYVYSYSELVSNGYVATSPFDSATVAAAAAGANLGSSTPEPTSGMLLLIGGSLLALRRRRRQA